jgi:hypothetical protein
MVNAHKTAIVTGALQGIGAGVGGGVPEAQLQRSGQLAQHHGYDPFAESPKLASLPLGTPVELEVIFDVGVGAHV